VLWAEYFVGGLRSLRDWKRTLLGLNRREKEGGDKRRAISNDLRGGFGR
jgi:hypothetical protein